MIRTTRIMAMPPHVTARYKQRKDDAIVKIETKVQYDQLMNLIQRGSKPYYINVIFETNFTANNVTMYYIEQDKEYEFEE